MKHWIILAALCAGASAPAAAATPWRVASSAHFVIYSQESAASLKAYAEKLERYDSALRFVFPVPAGAPASEDRLTIYAMPSAAAVQRIMGKGSNNVAGVYRPSATGSMAITARAEGGQTELNTQLVLLHEYAHHFMLRNFAAAYPTWFVEGFAEFASTARFDKDGSVGVGTPALHRAYELIQLPQFPLERMVGNDLRRMSREDRSSLYAWGWLLTHYLVFDESRRGQLNRYLQAINGGTRPSKAAQDVFGDLKKLQADLTRYRQLPRLYYMRIDQAKLKPGEVSLSEVSAGESSAIPIRVNSKYGVDNAEALKLVPLARQAAAPFSADPAAQCMLAEAEDDAANLDEADRAADRILAATPGHYCGLLFKGQVALHRASIAKAPSSDPRWSEARSWLAKANRADLQNPWPMYLYYTSFRISGAKPSENAVNALLGAAERAPQDAGVRIAATLELLRRDQPEPARIMLAPVANGGHDGAQSFLLDIYQRIGTTKSSTLADELAAGPSKTAEAAATPG